MFKNIKSHKVARIARSAHSCGLYSSIFTTVMLALSLIIPQNVVAQTQTPAIEVPTWAPYIMIGPNDLNDDSFNNHILTFGRGKTGENCGLWYISGSWNKAFNIGRTFNQQTSNPSSYTGGRHMFFVDSNMHIGIEYWPGQNSQSHKLDVNGKIRVEDCFHWSDRRYKREIEPISNIDNLFKINAVQYKPSGEAFAEQLEILKKSGTLSESDLAIAEAGTKATIEARNADNTLHYGFIAQELREVYPNLVSEDSRGLLHGQPLSRSMWEESDRFASAVVDNITEIDGKEVDVKRMILTGK